MDRRPLDQRLAMTVAQVAEFLQVDQHTVRRWLRSGEMGGFPLGGKAGWRILPSDVERFMAKRRDPARYARMFEEHEASG